MANLINGKGLAAKPVCLQRPGPSASATSPAQAWRFDRHSDMARFHNVDAVDISGQQGLVGQQVTTRAAAAAGLGEAPSAAGAKRALSAPVLAQRSIRSGRTTPLFAAKGCVVKLKFRRCVSCRRSARERMGRAWPAEKNDFQRSLSVLAS